MAKNMTKNANATTTTLVILGHVVPGALPRNADADAASRPMRAPVVDGARSGGKKGPSYSSTEPGSRSTSDAAATAEAFASSALQCTGLWRAKLESNVDLLGLKDRLWRRHLESKLRSGNASQSQLLYEARPFLKPITLVRSQLTSTLFLRGEEILKHVAKETVLGEQEDNHVPTVERVYRIFYGGNADPELSELLSDDEGLLEIDYADLGGGVHERNRGPGCLKENAYSHRRNRLPRAGYEIIVYVAPHPEMANSLPYNLPLRTQNHFPPAPVAEPEPKLWPEPGLEPEPTDVVVPAPAPAFKNFSFSLSSSPKLTAHRPPEGELNAMFGSFGAIRAEVTLRELDPRQLGRGLKRFDVGGGRGRGQQEERRGHARRSMAMAAAKGSTRSWSWPMACRGIQAAEGEDEVASRSSSASDDDDDTSEDEEVTLKRSFQAHLELIQSDVGRIQGFLMKTTISPAPMIASREAASFKRSNEFDIDIDDLIDSSPSSYLHYTFANKSPARSSLCFIATCSCHTERKRDGYIPAELRGSMGARLGGIAAAVTGADSFHEEGRQKARNAARQAGTRRHPQTVLGNTECFVADIGGAPTLPLLPMAWYVRQSVYEFVHAFDLKGKSEGKARRALPDS
ncbi:hypothetical protein BJY52DRAFT_1215537 [Lactarius psammicola]|nr:hypothetical protein BJY52DRAFT_1215537 [Lactarius psammicola]